MSKFKISQFLVLFGVISASINLLGSDESNTSPLLRVPQPVSLDQGTLGQGDEGIVESKAKADSVTLKYFNQDGVEHSIVLPATQISSLNLINTMLPEEGEEAGELEIPITSQIGSLVAFRFLEAYLQNPDQALKLLSEMPGEQIVDVLQLLEYLQFDFFTPVGQKLQAELLAQLRKKLSPEVIEQAWQRLGVVSGTPEMFRMGLEIFGDKVGFSPDGRLMWVSNFAGSRSKIQVYSVSTKGIGLIGEVSGVDAGFSSDNKWFWTLGQTGRITVYSFTEAGIGRVNAEFEDKIGSSPDGRYVWISTVDWNGFMNNRSLMVYKFTGVGLSLIGSVDHAISGGFSLDGGTLWVSRYIFGTAIISVFNITDVGLIYIGDAEVGPNGNFNGGLSLHGVWAWAGKNFSDGTPWIEWYKVSEGKMEELAGCGGIVVGFSGDFVWVKKLVSGKSAIQAYPITNKGLEELRTAWAGDDAGLDLNGVLMWIRHDNGDKPVISLYRTDGGALLRLGGLKAGNQSGFSPDGSLMWVSYLKKVSIFEVWLYGIPFDLYQKLTLVQQMLLMYLVREQQETGRAYQLRADAKLWPVWMGLPEKLRDYLVDHHIVEPVLTASLNRVLINPLLAFGLGVVDRK